MKKFALALSLAAGLFAVPVQAHPPAPPVVQPARQYYAIYYRSCPHEPWQYYGWTPCPTNAGGWVRYFNSQGYESFARPVRY